MNLFFPFSVSFLQGVPKLTKKIISPSITFANSIAIKTLSIPYYSDRGHAYFPHRYLNHSCVNNKPHFMPGLWTSRFLPLDGSFCIHQKFCIKNNISSASQIVYHGPYLSFFQLKLIQCVFSAKIDVPGDFIVHNKNWSTTLTNQINEFKYFSRVSSYDLNCLDLFFTIHPDPCQTSIFVFLGLERNMEH